MSLEDKQYTLVWRLMPDGWADAVSVEAAPGVMPHFVDGGRWQLQAHAGSAAATGDPMLCGVLMSWSQTEKYWWGAQPERIHRFLLRLLEHLREVSGEASLETLMVNAAGRVRGVHGPRPAARIWTHSEFPFTR